MPMTSSPTWTKRSLPSMGVSEKSLDAAGVRGLFPSGADREQWDALLARELALAAERVTAGPVTSTLDLAAFQRELAEFDFAAPRPLEELLPWVVARMEHGLVHLTHPRYFGLFNPAPTFPSQCADRIVAAFNPQLASSRTSPAAVAIEQHVIRSVAQRAGLPPQSGGHFTTSGSEANYTALICALTRASPSFSSQGARGFSGPPVFYVSKDCHLAWLKIAHQAGIGRSAVRLIVTDGGGRMEQGALEGALESDRAQGAVPIMVVATAGTSNAGMVDPLPACAAIARKAGLWYHVDAAWAGALIASKRHADVLSGLEQADSVTIDAHKWLATTMGCGMFLTRHVSVLSEAFQVAVSFMPSNIPDVDPYVTTMQWSRRFLGLRLFLSLAAVGWAGYAKHVERSIDLLRLAETRLAQRGWRVANASPAGVLCVLPPAGSADVRTLVARVVASGQAWVAPALFEGVDTVRICVTHGESRPADVEALVDALQSAR